MGGKAQFKSSILWREGDRKSTFWFLVGSNSSILWFLRENDRLVARASNMMSHSFCKSRRNIDCHRLFFSTSLVL